MEVEVAERDDRKSLVRVKDRCTYAKKLLAPSDAQGLIERHRGSQWHTRTLRASALIFHGLPASFSQNLMPSILSHAHLTSSSAGGLSSSPSTSPSPISTISPLSILPVISPSTVTDADFTL